MHFQSKLPGESTRSTPFNVTERQDHLSTQSLLSSIAATQLPKTPILILGIKKKTTQSDFNFDDVYQNVYLADNLTVCIEPYRLYCSSTSTFRVTTEKFPTEFQKIISLPDQQELLDSLKASCLQANAKRWHLVSKCTELPFHYRRLLWTRSISQTYWDYYLEWKDELDERFGRPGRKVLVFCTYLPFLLCLYITVVVVGLLGFLIDVGVGRFCRRRMTCTHNQIYDMMMTVPEDSTPAIDESIQKDLEAIALTLERKYHQIEIIVSAERFLLPSTTCSSCCSGTPIRQPSHEIMTHDGLSTQDTIHTPFQHYGQAHKDYNHYLGEQKIHHSFAYEEHFVLTFYPSNTTRILSHHPTETLMEVSMKSAYSGILSASTISILPPI